ncbi:hypothetical protein D1007_26540 [Hordeum vulgare]|nr:hypothetical protein D1007_26540 [Hordeum vulgare]
MRRVRTGPTAQHRHLPSRSRSLSADTDREFIVRMEGTPRTWLWLPDSFAEEMEEHAPVGLWLQPNGYWNRPTWVATEFNSLGFMFLRRGWKSFVLA